MCCDTEHGDAVAMRNMRVCLCSSLLQSAANIDKLFVPLREGDLPRATVIGTVVAVVDVVVCSFCWISVKPITALMISEHKQIFVCANDNTALLSSGFYMDDGALNKTRYSLLLPLID